MNAVDRVIDAADRIARRFTLWKLTRDLRGYTFQSSPSPEPLAEAERWTGKDDTCIVLEQDVDRQRGTVILSLDGWHRLAASAGYVRTDDLSPEDAT